MSYPTFKPYNQNQLMLLPPDLSDMVPEDHMVRVVDKVVESLNITTLESLYPGGGAPAYNPRMMLKVIIFAYASGIYSSRKISEATHSNIYFLWLTGLAPLDHMTINRFRTERLQGAFEEIFTSVVMMLADLGYVSLETYFLDGTKIEASANKYSYTWRKSTEKNREKLRARIGELLGEIDALNEEEDKIFEDTPEPTKPSADDIEKISRKINEQLEKAPDNKQLKKAKRLVEGDYLPRMRRYERDLKDMEGRNSLSKTDRDATFMHMKEDAAGTGQPKAGYNVQNGTENQFVIHTTVHQRPGDTACLIPHVESLKNSLGHTPKEFVADAGYGSEENYEYLENEKAEAFVKYNTFHKEQKKSFAQNPTQPANWAYDADSDEYECAGGKKLSFVDTRTDTSELGYTSTSRIYASEDCTDCPLCKKCLKAGQINRRIHINPHRDNLRQKAAARLKSDKGIELRKRRSTDVETVFGDVKRNWGFRRFSLRGIEKVAHEWRLVMMGHNIRKLTRKLFEGTIGPRKATA